MQHQIPPMENITRTREIISKIRDIVGELDRQANNANSFSPAYVIPGRGPAGSPQYMLCCKTEAYTETPNKIHKETKTDDKKLKSLSKVKPSKSRELRGGILYVGCDCEKRNGLQDDCHRSECFGSPPCLTKPPSCGPSAYSNAKHLKRFHIVVDEQNKTAGETGMSGDRRTEGAKKDEGKLKCIPVCVIKPPLCPPCAAL